MKIEVNVKVECNGNGDWEKGFGKNDSPLLYCK